MRSLVCIFVLALTACAAAPKRAAETPGPTFLLGAEPPYVALDAPGWHRSPGTEKDQMFLHWHDHKDTRVLAVWIKPADPGSTVEGAMTKFAAMIMAVPVLFSQVEATPVQTLSDEEATFGFRGVDSKTGTRMAALCRVKLVSGHGTAYWAMILTFAPETMAPRMLFDADMAAKNLRILAPIPPK